MTTGYLHARRPQNSHRLPHAQSKNRDYNPWAYSPQSWRILQVENVKEIVALNVRLARQALGISQEELSERAGIDLSYGSRIERGKANPSIEVLAKLGEALGVSAAALLTARD